MKRDWLKKRSVLGTLCALMLIGLVVLPALLFSNAAHRLAGGKPVANTFSLQIDSGPIPDVLSSSDRALYARVFDAQRRQDWQEADLLMNEIDDQQLLGYVLAERYLHRKYTTRADELEAWLANFRDLPQAFDIYQLAQRKFATKAKPIDKPELITMRGDDNGLAANFDESKHYNTWKNGIAAYHAGSYAKAAEQFEKMLADRQTLSPWKISAAGFWAWRSYTKLGERGKAYASLKIASSEPRSFYGILARKQLGQKLDLDASDLTLSQGEMNGLKRTPAVMRAIALVEAGRGDLAERDLRSVYSSLSLEDRHATLRLAHQLSLSALQIALAKRLETKEERLDLAKYPIPEWQPVGGFNVDPALIYALVRQESGFRSGAISPAGAMGLMQLMPTTATMMSHKIGMAKVSDVSDAEKNITLGQSYVRHLLQNQLVENNMIFMLAAYNAGIGRLQEWKNSIDYRGDPLLFIERMPYAETRYYVMQVMTNYWLYNEILGISSPTLAALAQNHWPVYIPAEDMT